MKITLERLRTELLCSRTELETSHLQSEIDAWGGSPTGRKLPLRGRSNVIFGEVVMEVASEDAWRGSPQYFIVWFDGKRKQVTKNSFTKAFGPINA